MKKLTTETMIEKATKAGGYYSFRFIAAQQRDCDTKTGAKLAETATDFCYAPAMGRSRLISREEAETMLAEMQA